MKQVLHIFAKDSRRFWPEILISLAITAAFAWIYPLQWAQDQSQHSMGGSFFLFYPTLLPAILVVLVPIGWWLLITRVVHAENLVGDRQFWITRPYEWKKLLAAKLLFLAVFLYLPIFVAHCVLLLAAGFHPLSYLPGLLFNLLLITGILVVPVFALAAVTSTFARMTLTLLGVLLCIISIAIVSSFFGIQSISTPYEDRASIPILLCVCGAAIVLQYAARRVWLARLLLITPLVLIGIIALAVPDSTLLQRFYPRPAGPQDMLVQLSFNPDPLHQVIASGDQRTKQIALNIPLQASNVADGYAVTPNDVMASIEAPNGAHWTLAWQAIYSQNYLPGLQSSHVQIMINRDLYDRLRSTPVTLHLTFALTQVHAGKVTRVAMPGHNFFVPDFGVCSPDSTFEFTGITCRSALRQPRLTYVEVLWSDTPCSAAQPEPGTGVQGSGWIGNLSRDPAEFGITSVWNPNLPLSNGVKTHEGDQPHPRHLCPGSPLTFTQYNLVRRTRFDLTIPEIHLPDYNQP